LKLVGFPVAEIWLIFGHGVKRPDDRPLTFSPVNGVTAHPCHGPPSCLCSDSSPVRSRLKSQVRDWQRQC